MRRPSVAPKNAGRARVPEFVRRDLAAERELPSESKASLHARYEADRGSRVGRSPGPSRSRPRRASAYAGRAVKTAGVLSPPAERVDIVLLGEPVGHPLHFHPASRSRFNAKSGRLQLFVQLPSGRVFRGLPRAVIATALGLLHPPTPTSIGGGAAFASCSGPVTRWCR